MSTRWQPKESIRVLTKGRLTSAFVQATSIAVALFAASITLLILNQNTRHVTHGLDLFNVASGLLPTLILLGLVTVFYLAQRAFAVVDINRTEKKLKRAKQRLDDAKAAHKFIRQAWYWGRVKFLESRLTRYDRQVEQFNQIVDMLEQNEDLRYDVRAYLTVNDWRLGVLLPSVAIAVTSVLLAHWWGM